MIKKTNKFKRVVVAIAMMLIVGLSANAYDFEVGGLYYTITSPNEPCEVAVTSGDVKYSGNVVIPESVTYNEIEYSVTSIGSNAFLQCVDLTSLEIPELISSISEYSFQGCNSLLKVVWNAKSCVDFSYASPFDTGSYGWGSSSNITSFEFGETVEHIPAFLCYGMTNLAEVTIPNSVTSVGQYAFYNTGITSIEIPNSITTIGGSAFADCSSLTNIVWNPVNMTDFNYNSAPFVNLSAVTSFEFGETVEHIPAYLCYGMANLTEVSIPNSVTSIGQYAFYRTGITSIEIPSSITSIGNSVFADCSSLTNVVWNPVNMTDFNYDSAPFAYLSTITSFEFGETVEHIPAYLCYGMANLAEVSIPNSVTSIGKYAFYSTGITSIEIPNTVTSIGNLAFADCSSLNSVVWNPVNMTDFNNNSAPFDSSSATSFEFGETVEHIPAYLCYRMANLAEVTIPNSVTSIGASAFYSTGITNIEIPNTVTSIGNLAFAYCSSLNSVVWNPANMADFTSSSNAPFNSSSATSFKFGDSVEHIPAYLCYRMENLAEVTIPNSVTSIGQYAFSNTGITSIEIPNSITTIGGSAFANCSSLNSVVWNPVNMADFASSSNAPFNSSSATSFVFGETVEHIPAYLCYGMTNLAEVIIPKAVSSIGILAFSDCYNIKKIVWNAVECKDVIDQNGDIYPPFINYNAQEYNVEEIVFGEFVKYIPSYLCYEMTKLSEITIPNSVTSIGSYVFCDCSGLKNVVLPNSIESVSYGLFYGCSNLDNIEIPNQVKLIDDGAFYNCSGLTNIVIPESVNAIDFSAFKGCLSLKHIEIPETVISIGNSAFANCSSLNSVVWNPVNIADFASSSNAPFNGSSAASFEFGETVEHIPAYLCYGMTNLAEVTIPNSVTSVGQYAFSNTGITSVEIPSSITSIGNSAFANCSRLTNVVWNPVNMSNFNSYSNAPFKSSSATSFVFGETVEHIPAYLCYGMTNLAEVTIPKSVTSIGNSAFAECSSLTNVVWNATNCANFSNAPFTYYNSSTYEEESSVESVVFGETVEHIPAYLCYRMTKLAEVTIPSSITSIGNSAFAECSSLTNVVWNATNCADFSDSPFTYYNYSTYEEESSVESVIFGETVEHIPAYLCYGMANLVEVSIPNSVTSIGARVFYNTGITSIEIPSSITSIGNSAFKGCSSLTNIVWNPVNMADFTSSSNAPFNASSAVSFEFGETVEHIPAYLCYGMTNLAEVTIPNSVTSIGQYAFYRTGITSIEIPSSITSIGNSVFAECSSLTNVVWNPVNMTDFNYNGAPFAYLSTITSFEFGETVEHIPAYLCYGMTNLAEVTIPNSVTSIGAGVFYNTGITSIEIPSSITSIGNSAFAGCSSLTNVVWNATNCADFSNAPFTYYNSSTYEEESSVESVVFGETVEHIPAYLCCGMTNLAEVTIPNSVTSIGAGVFYNIGITSIEIPSSITSIGNSAFVGCGSLTNVVWNATNCADFTSDGIPFVDPYDISSNIASFEFGETVEHIPAYLCYGMTRLTEVTIPNSVTSIGSYVFANCSGLKNVVLPNSIESVSYGLFYDCSSLTNIVIPESVNAVDSYAFFGCNGITDITIGESVVSIGEYVFDSHNLRVVNCLSIQPPVISENTFSNYLAKLYVPEEGYEDYASDAIWSKFSNINDKTNVDINNKLYINDFNIEPGEIKDVAIILDNTDEFVNFQAYITLPEGLEFVYNEDEYDYCWYDGDRINTKLFTCSSQFQDSNNKIILIEGENTKSGATISATTGAFMYVRIKADNNLTGVKTIRLENIIFTQADGIQRTLESSETIVNGSQSDDSEEIKLIVTSALHGTISFYLEKGKSQKVELAPEMGYAIHSITFNDEEVKEILIDNCFTTPILTENATLNVVFEIATGVDEVIASDRVRVTAANGYIKVNGTVAGEQVHLYTSNGVLVNSAISNGDEIEFEANAGEIYIVKTLNHIVKVMM